MSTHAEKVQAHKNPSAAKKLLQENTDTNTAYQFVDNRAKTSSKRELQDLANNGPLNDRLHTIQKKADDHFVQQQPSLHEKESIKRPVGNVPIQQLKSKTSVNDDAGLEREADVMGAKALQLSDRPTGTALSLAPISGTATTLQGKWILKNGSPVEVDDEYVLQDGESDLDISVYTQTPRIIFDEGNKIGKYDQKGQISFEDFDSSIIPTHEKLQEEREKQGSELAKRLLASKDIKSEADKIQTLAEKLEKESGKNVPKNHSQKVHKLAKHKFSGKQFRNIIKAQDEFSQSESTASLFDGLIGGISSSINPDVQRFVEQALRAFSSLRARTGSVSAPMEYNGNLVGQQHPTSWTKHKKLPNGGSGHSYADRQRVEMQNKAFKDLALDKEVSASTLLISNLLSALVATLSTMASPHTASNVPDFDEDFDDEQHKDREQIKKQTQTVSEEFGFEPMKKKVQKMDKPFKAYDYPSSPLRLQDASSSDEEEETEPIEEVSKSQDQFKIVSKEVVTTNENSSSITISSDFMKKLFHELNLKSQQQNQLELINRIMASLPIGDITTPIYWQYNTMLGYIGNLQVGVYGDAILLNYYQHQIVGLYQQVARFIHRATIGGNHNGVNGFIGINRINALEQFMTECGQMATHNAIALETAQGEHNNFANVDQYIGDNNALAGLGNFDNFIGEDDIRQLLANAGHAGIPVIGNLGQVQTFIRDLNQFEQMGQALFNRNGVGRQLLQQLWPIGNVEMQEIQALNNFIQGTTNQLNFIINTNGHQIISGGYHWITVRLERDHNGVRLFFLDSLRGDNDYSALFQGLSNFINNQNIQGGDNVNPLKRRFKDI